MQHNEVTTQQYPIQTMRNKVTHIEEINKIDTNNDEILSHNEITIPHVTKYPHHIICL